MPNTRETLIRGKLQTKKARTDRTYKYALLMISSMMTLFIIGMIVFLLYNGISGFFTFTELTIGNFLFGNYYNPTSTSFAAGFMIVNTLWISFLSLSIAVPIAVFTALFIAKMAPKKLRSSLFVVVSILAAIPTVIYGAFGLFVIDSVIRFLFGVPPGTVLSVVVTLAFMIVPTITILTITSIEAVDDKVQSSALALGATKTQTSFRVTLKGASKGILVAVLLGLGRALGEATAVSMVASQSAYGPTFSIFGFTTLITATMLQGFPEVASGSIEEASMFAMTSLLLITIIMVFLAMKLIEKRMDIENISRISSENKIHKKKIMDAANNGDVADLSRNDFHVYAKELNREKVINEEIENKSISYSISTVMNHNSLESNRVQKSSRFKKRESVLENIITIVFASFGILLLSAIIVFLFSGGFSVLNWDYLTSKGVYMIDSSTHQNIYGLAVPIFGTVIIIIIALSIALTFGLLISILTSIYLTRDSKFSNAIGFFVHLLTGIPSLIYGIIGSIIFLPLFTNDVIHLSIMSAGLTISLFILPTILKTTQEGFAAIDSTQKEASLALGGTNWITAKKVLTKQAMPSIISAAIVATGIIIADSAIFITIYGTLSQDTLVEWVRNGGTTLSTEIYKLTKQEEILWEYVKAIGIVIIFLIVIISSLASKIKGLHYKDAMIMLVGIILVLISIYMVIFALFIVGLILIISSVFIFSLWRMLDRKYFLNKTISRFINEIRVGI